MSDGGTSGGNQQLAQALAEGFRRHGVTLTFGQSIPSAFHLAAADIGIRQIGYRTENAGAVMADGYARISGRIGVVTAQNGPAATLLVPGLGEALKASIPVLALVQDVATDQTDRNAFQDFEHIALFTPCTKWVRRCADPDRIDDYLDMAVVAATSGRPGPAVLLVPVDLLTQPVRGGTRGARLGHYPLDRTRADDATITAAADLLVAAACPVVVAGGGVHLSGAATALARLQEVASLPVGTTIMGKGGVDERHPLSLGITGNVMGERSLGHEVRDLYREADVVLLVGTRTNQTGTDSWAMFGAEARFIHLDMAGEEIGRNFEALRVAGDARLNLEALNAALEARDLGRRRAARPEIEARIAHARARRDAALRPLATSDASPIRPERIMLDAARFITPETIVVGDASYSHVWVAVNTTSLAPGMRFLTPRGIAGLGWGLPLALGAQCARPDARVLCFAGDGGFGHVWSELETARRMDLPVVVTVFNNGVLGFQKDAEDVRLGRHTDACHFAPVDHAAIARACGCEGFRIERPADYAPALEAALASARPAVLDVVTDPEAYPPLTLFDGTLEARRAAARA